MLSVPNQLNEEYKTNLRPTVSTSSATAVSPGKWSTMSNISTQENPVPTSYTKYESGASNS